MKHKYRLRFEIVNEDDEVVLKHDTFMADFVTTFVDEQRQFINEERKKDLPNDELAELVGKQMMLIALQDALLKTFTP